MFNKLHFCNRLILRLHNMFLMHIVQSCMLILTHTAQVTFVFHMIVCCTHPVHSLYFLFDRHALQIMVHALTPSRHGDRCGCHTTTGVCSLYPLTPLHIRTPCNNIIVCGWLFLYLYFHTVFKHLFPKLVFFKRCKEKVDQSFWYTLRKKDLLLL